MRGYLFFFFLATAAARTVTGGDPKTGPFCCNQGTPDPSGTCKAMGLNSYALIFSFKMVTRMGVTTGLCPNIRSDATSRDLLRILKTLLTWGLTLPGILSLDLLDARHDYNDLKGLGRAGHVGTGWVKLSQDGGRGASGKDWRPLQRSMRRHNHTIR
ncbi:hypothetical protein LX32DRAFT_47199 [Colletotrichum zoysiae]|uniref:Uncharacterized protein n=1 Tax=Colletotrichum zoysiae TaxID=1216348 RepID=A0AAD9HCD5_9PEZI|nr:hypothetical protein LX32DRAFT_47199 [Colletotrichum zoysiae]